MNLKFIGFRQQHLFQIGSCLEGVQLSRMEPRGAGICRLWELVQEGGVCKEGLFRLPYTALQLLGKEKGQNADSSPPAPIHGPQPLPLCFYEFVVAAPVYFQ